MGMHQLLAGRTNGMETNMIREILKVVSKPGMISLAGGIPAPESFPLDLMATLTGEVLERWGAGALQYDRTEGFIPLQEALADYLKECGVTAAPDAVLISSGSQGVLDALGKVLIDKGDRVAVEAPTYLGALSAFTPYEPTYVPLATDAEGVIPASLEAALRAGPLKFVYLVPTFQNPTGRTLSEPRRREIARIIQAHDALLVEDDPYSALRYTGTPQPPVQRFAPDHVVYISTLSKVFAPGLRIGFCVAPPEIRKWLVTVKQGTDLHTATFNQALAAAYIGGGHLRKHLPAIRALYAPKQQAMLDALARHFPEGCTWSRPEGGMFVWVTGPDGTDMDRVYRAAVRRKTAFVPGRCFYPVRGEGRETMRLNFTMNTPETIDRAVRIIGELVAEEGAGGGRRRAG